MIHDLMTRCIILNNMIIEVEHDLDAPTEVGREASDLVILSKITHIAFLPPAVVGNPVTN